MLRYEIILDHGETANKCTIKPLSYRNDFFISHVSGSRCLRFLYSQILLHPDGKPFSEPWGEGIVTGIAAVDCVWRRLPVIMKKIADPIPEKISIPPEFVTAYPRCSKLDFDPSGGLATIEALFIAAAFCGSWDESLLREYYFADRFIELNHDVFKNYGIEPPRRGGKPIFKPAYSRNAHTRRVARGRHA